jgi:Large polyvalent protein associated domain 29
MIGSKEYLSCKETAVLVRGALKKAFPGQKFSVRSKTYSGGASIDVSYVDGPTAVEVERVVGAYAGSNFDGMIDLKYHNDSWLMPDGSVAYAKTGGGGSTVPERITSAPSPNAKLVSLGADYVFVHRDVSDEWREEVISEFERVLGRPLPRDDRDWWRVQAPLRVDGLTGELHRMVDTDQEYLSATFNAYTSTRNRTTGAVVTRYYDR